MDPGGREGASMDQSLDPGKNPVGVRVWGQELTKRHRQEEAGGQGHRVQVRRQRKSLEGVQEAGAERQDALQAGKHEVEVLSGGA